MRYNDLASDEREREMAEMILAASLGGLAGLQAQDYLATPLIHLV